MDTLNLLDGEELVALARLDLENNQLEHAIRKLKLARKLQTFPAELHALLGKAFARLGLFERAKVELSAYVEKKPESVQERFELGLACRDSGSEQEALDHWDRVLRDQPVHPPALFFRSLVLLDQQRNDEGVDGLKLLIGSAGPENLYVKRAAEVLAALDERETPVQQILDDVSTH